MAKAFRGLAICSTSRSTSGSSRSPARGSPTTASASGRAVRTRSSSSRTTRRFTSRSRTKSGASWGWSAKRRRQRQCKSGACSARSPPLQPLALLAPDFVLDLLVNLRAVLDNSKQFLKDNPEIYKQIEDKIRRELGMVREATETASV